MAAAAARRMKPERCVASAALCPVIFRSLKYNSASFSAQPASAAVQSPSSSSSSSSDDGSPLVFPREGPSVSYALNWSLASACVTPSGQVHRNLKPSQLSAAAAPSPQPPAPTAPASLLVHGATPPSDPTHPTASLPFPAYTKMFKQVTSHLSSSSPLFVHEGAVGSSSSLHCPVRVISDTPSVTAAFSSLLTPTPTSSLSHSVYPLTVYSAALMSPAPSPLSLVAHFPSSSLLLPGSLSVSPPPPLLLSALSALAEPHITLSHKALLLHNASVSSDVLVLSPSSSSPSSLLLSSSGIGRLFGRPHPSQPNLTPLPKALVLRTSDTDNAIPFISKLTPSQSAYYFLLGYSSSSFLPSYRPSSILSVVSPLQRASAFHHILSSSSLPVFLVNAPDKSSLSRAVSAIAANEIPASKGLSQTAMNELKEKMEAYAKSEFGELPVEIAP